MSYLNNNILDIEERIEKAAKKSGRKRNDITLVGVTKTVPANIINEAVNLGITEVGENKVQEMLEKYEKVKGVNWHFIGHLQTNKVKYIIDKVHLIHSVDSLKLAKEINKRASQVDRCIDILIQVNVSGENSKFGVSLKECENFINEVSKFSHIKIKGFMTMAPFVENPEQVRKYFRKLKEFSVNIMGNNVDNLSIEYLSMGMSGDFEVAIEEGANVVRVGSAIFGKR